METNLDLQVLNRIIDLGRMSAGPQVASGANVPYVMLGDGTVRLLTDTIYNDHEKPLRRVQAVVETLDPESFIAYFNLFKDDDSRIFADEAKTSIKAVLDYHTAGAPNNPKHGGHRVVLSLRLSEQWKTWASANNKKFSQTEFAEFLEQNAIDITRPDPASIMEVARDLQATTEVEFGSAQRQNDGQVRFKYTETTKASVGASQLAVPEDFRITLPVFVGGESVPLDALLRFRTPQGKLTIWYTLVRPEDAIRAGFAKIRHHISKELGLVVINGSPSA